ncbi:tudor domain-containing protein 1-like, partial [Mantella aurantiaca]
MECQRLDWKVHSIICKPAAVKETNGEKLLNNNNNGERKSLTKPCEAPPPSRGKEEEGRRVMLCDLKVETLSEGTEIKGYVSDFCSPSDFSVQEYNAKSIENLMKLSALLKNVYSSLENLRKDYVPQIREVCAAKYSKDQQWYRVLVYNVESSMSKAQVLYLDYGNQEILSLCDLQPMHGDLELTPPCAMHFGVAHSLAPPYGWSPECLVEVKRLLMGQQLDYRIVHVDQQEIPRYSVEVSLPETGKLLHKVMEEKGYSFVSHMGRPSQEIPTDS